ncbi:MAG: hypothetical protein J6A15_04380 [Clostridia bacterium]|nr:hypothetical protein [Clostridia bacterium]
MDYIIFCISVIGILCICYIMDNNCFLYSEMKNKSDLKIILTKENVDYSQKKEIINKVMTGDYDNILDIVDNMRIN